MSRSFLSRRLLVLCLISVLPSPVAAGAAAQTGPGAPELVSPEITLRFDGRNGGLAQISDTRTKHDFLEAGSTDGALWTIDFLPGPSPNTISSSSPASFRWELTRTGGPGVKLIWERFRDPAARGLRVEVQVGIFAGLSRWNINIQDPGGLRIEKVGFPRITHIQRQPDERLAVPIWMGALARDPRSLLFDATGKPVRLEWPYPGRMSLQCLAWYRENGPGLYLSCDDASAFRKAFAFWGEGSRKAGYEMVHLPETTASAAATFAPKYAAVIGTFSGDWVTASERYREWGLRQEWAKQSRLNRRLVPQWLLDTGVWVWNRGRSDQVLKPAEALKQRLQLPVSVFWHWWHGCPYDTGFPEYLPPREGADSFRQAVGEARKQGLNAIVYMNQRLWGMTTRSWQEKGAERFAVKTLSGEIRPEIYNTYTGQACASMCMATPFWRDTYAGIAEQAVRDLGVSGIYMDQACSSLACYDPSHGHPLGGGTFWMNGFRLLSADIRKRTRAARRVLLAGEGSGEAWLPHLDLMLTLEVSRERFSQPGDGWDVIPFFQAVYHSSGITYGNYSALTVPPYDELWPAEFAPKEPLKLLDRRYARQFYLEQARTFVWGIQPTISNFMPSHFAERPEETGYLLKLARIRHNNLKYLLHGTFLRPPALDVPETSVDISRLSIYAGRRGKRQSKDEEGRDVPQTHTTRTSPAVLAGAWRANDGSVAVALASIVDTPVAVNLDLSPYGIRRDEPVFVTAEAGRRELERSGASTVTVPLKALGVCLVEVPRTKTKAETPQQER